MINIAKSEEKQCCRKGKFPTLAVILLVVGVAWLLNSMNVFTITIPWVPIVLIIVAIGMMVNLYTKE